MFVDGRRKKSGRDGKRRGELRKSRGGSSWRGKRKRVRPSLEFFLRLCDWVPSFFSLVLRTGLKKLWDTFSFLLRAVSTKVTAFSRAASLRSLRSSPVSKITPRLYVTSYS